MRSVKVPSNAPAIPGVDDSINATAQIAVAPIGEVSFVVSADPRGEEDRGRGFLVRPSRPLPEGTSQLALALTCSVPASGGGGVKPVPHPLVVGPPSPLPTSVGTVTAGSSPSIIRFALTPELAAYIEVAQLNVTHDPAQPSFFTWRYGEVRSGVTIIEVGYEPTRGYAFPQMLGSVMRDVRPRMDASELCAGKSGTASFPIELSAHIAGADVDPSAALGSVAVDCDAARKEHEEATISPAASGCGVGHSRAREGWSAASLVVAAAVLARIGRRRRRTVVLAAKTKRVQNASNSPFARES